MSVRKMLKINYGGTDPHKHPTHAFSLILPAKSLKLEKARKTMDSGSTTASKPDEHERRSGSPPLS